MGSLVYSAALVLVGVGLCFFWVIRKRSAENAAPDGFPNRDDADVAEEILRLDRLQHDISRARGTVRGWLEVLSMTIKDVDGVSGHVAQYGIRTVEGSAARSAEAMDRVRREYLRAASGAAPRVTGAESEGR